MENGNPEFLYHYTTIESLALILKNKTIRFNNLVDLDDLEEGRSSDFLNPGKLVFVSCWTYSDDDNIPLWHMYSEKMEGVRLKLPIRPFGSKPAFEDNHFDLGHCSFGAIYESNEYDISFNFLFNELSLKMEYTDEESKLKPCFVTVDKANHMLNIKQLGHYKRKCWEFQNESRYVITFLPNLSNWGKDYKSQKDAIEAFFKKDLTPAKDVFLLIEDEEFKKMEIMLGPCVNDGQKAIVQSLIEKYNSNAKLTQSQLTGKIKF